ncbi:MAG: VWA domain-containing protein [Polyangia bacterium]|jgi:hypothetical protein|nr:VWA domain-containing protein [Polyangia bacterium]
MTSRILLLKLAALLGLAACGPSDSGTPGNGNNNNNNNTVQACVSDADGDGICDEHEGRAQNVDTDGDGTPDYQDLDSDGDGIADSVERGNVAPGSPPVDSDGDAIPDFRDLDSDQNGIPDNMDGMGDQDQDSIPDFADLDDDGDGIADAKELQESPFDPPDSDGDGVPDYKDTDSDDDDILDMHEGGGGFTDTDQDSIPDYLDLDSDNDGIPDAIEAGDSDPNTPPVDTDGDLIPDYRDPDSDNDGLPDSLEDPNGNGVVDPGETDPRNADSDGDGVTDLIEVAAGTDPNNPTDNPQAHGDFVFMVPFEEPPSPTEDDLDFSTSLVAVDVYVLVDRSGSMTSEITSIRTNMQTVANNITCPPLGTGDPATCIPDVWWGVGTVGYAGSGGQPYTNHLDLQSNPSLITSNLPTSEPGGCCAEPLQLATWSVVTGNGSAASGCSVTDAYLARTSCDGSPAGPTGIGYPCFRPGALPVVLLTTDEAPTSTQNCPGLTTVISAANAIGARIVGIKGSGGAAQLQTDLAALATGTGAVDANNGNAPLVMQGDDANAANAIENGIRLLANGVPLDLSARSVDDPADGVDAVTNFVDRLETLQLGTPECTSGLTDQDTNSDGYPDQFVQVIAGTPVCWRLVPKQNITIEPTREPQVFMATVEVWGDNVTLLDTRDVYFLVPPLVDIPIIPQ